jgi:hypothetical protein
MTWTQDEAIDLCRKVEDIAPNFGCHVALTGGCLYKHGPRKDCDLLFYRIRQTPEIDREGLLTALKRIGLYMGNEHGWVQKASYEGKSVDLFFPDYDDAGQYPIGGDNDEAALIDALLASNPEEPF